MNAATSADARALRSAMVAALRNDGLSDLMIWDQIESAYATWDALGRPARHAFGLTVTATGQHIVWHDRPAHQLWHLEDNLIGDSSSSG